MSGNGALSADVVELDLHGVLGVQVHGGSPRAVDRIERQIGGSRSALGRQPDIVIRFEDLGPRTSLTYLGLNTSAFDDEGFYVLDRNTGAIQARIPLDQVGGPCVLSCPPDVESVPLLMDIVRYRLLANGYIPLHASAFRHRGTGVLVMGWAKGGKTELLLAAASRGADYVGDEWVMLSADGSKMFGLPVSVALREWHIEQVPELVPRVGLQQRLLFGAIGVADSAHTWLARSRWKRSFARKSLERGLPRLRQQRMIRKAPRELFGDRCRLEPVDMDKIVLIMSDSEPDVRIAPADPVDVAHRMAASVAYEQMQFVQYYRSFTFAFPDRRNEFLDRFDDRCDAMLCEALQGQEAYAVLHPYPVAFDALFDAVETVLDS